MEFLYWRGRNKSSADWKYRRDPYTEKKIGNHRTQNPIGESLVAMTATGLPRLDNQKSFNYMTQSHKCTVVEKRAEKATYKVEPNSQ